LAVRPFFEAARPAILHSGRNVASKSSVAKKPDELFFRAR